MRLSRQVRLAHSTPTPRVAGQPLPTVSSVTAVPANQDYEETAAYSTMIREAQRLALRGVLGPRNGPTYPSCARLRGRAEAEQLREASRMVNEYIERHVPQLIQQVLNGGSATITGYEAAAGWVDWLKLIGRYWDKYQTPHNVKPRLWLQSITEGVLKDLPRRILAACGELAAQPAPEVARSTTRFDANKRVRDPAVAPGQDQPVATLEGVQHVQYAPQPAPQGSPYARQRPAQANTVPEATDRRTDAPVYAAPASKCRWISTGTGRGGRRWVCPDDEPAQMGERTETF